MKKYRIKGVVAYWNPKTMTNDYIETSIHDYFEDGYIFTCVADMLEDFRKYHKNLIHANLTIIDTTTGKKEGGCTFH